MWYSLCLSPFNRYPLFCPAEMTLWIIPSCPAHQLSKRIPFLFPLNIQLKRVVDFIVLPVVLWIAPASVFIYWFSILTYSINPRKPGLRPPLRTWFTVIYLQVLGPILLSLTQSSLSHSLQLLAVEGENVVLTNQSLYWNNTFSTSGYSTPFIIKGWASTTYWNMQFLKVLFLPAWKIFPLQFQNKPSS